MKNIKMIGIIIAVVVLVSIGFIALVIWGNLNPTTMSTTDISDYNTEEYSLDWHYIFPETIPENAEVLDFLYYEYSCDFEDYYLELKFDTPEELLEYLSIRIETVESKLSNQPYYTFEEGVFVEEQNPYDASYVDLFFAYKCWGDSDGECRVGYTIKGSDRRIDVLYNVISYSMDELIVIHEYTMTRNYYTAEQKLPTYFIRFGVDTDIEIERWIKFHQIYKNQTDDE